MGVAQFKLELPEYEIVAALIASGVMSEDEALRHQLVEHELAANRDRMGAKVVWGVNARPKIKGPAYARDGVSIGAL